MKTGIDTVSRDEKKLFDYIDKHFNKLQKKTLDLSELVIPTENWDKYRAKMLRIANDVRRDIQQEISDNYNLKFSPKVIYEDVIEVKVPGLNERRYNKDE